MRTFFKSLLSTAAFSFVLGLLQSPLASPTRRRHLFWGTILFLAAFFSGGLTLVALLTTLFFYLAGLSNFVTPGLLTSLLALLVTLLLASLGWGKFRQ